MARTPDDEIERIKREVDLVRLVTDAVRFMGPEPPPARSTMLPPPTLPAHAPAAEERA